MAFKINNVNIAEEYSSIVCPNLYADGTMQPGVTFNPHTLENAGGRFVPKVTADGVKAPKNQAGDYDVTEAADTLIPILANNYYRPSKKIYGAQINAVGYDIVEENMSALIKGTLRPSYNTSALACLAQEGTDLVDDTTTVLTKDTIGDYLLKLRKQLRDKGATGNVLIVSTDIYVLIQQAAGAEFDSEPKNAIVASGKVGYWKGWFIVESNLFGWTGNNTAKYYDSANELKTVDLSKVEMIAYDWEKFYIDELLEMLDVVDGGNTYNGVQVVTELVCGFKVADPACVLVKKKS